jgi:hypothetical protein
MGVEKGDLWLKRGANERARAVTLKLADILNVGLHRVGKMAEMIFAPIGPEELLGLRRHIFGSLDETPANIQASLTFVRKAKDEECNFVLGLKAAPVIIARPCHVEVKVDINNRDMTRSLDPADLTRVWKVADEHMPDWLFQKLGGQDE